MVRGLQRGIVKRVRVMTGRVPLVLSILLLIMVPPLLPAQPASDAPSLALSRDQASAFARLALQGLGKEYPNKPGHVLTGEADVRSPRAVHPAFYGCYDWHSSVHG